MDDATLLSLIEKGRIIAAAIVVLGVAGEFLGDFIASPIIKRRDDAQRAEIARLNKEAEDARKSAGEAIERAAKLEKDAAELNRKAEEERLARVKLEEYNTPRRITDKQGEILVAELKSLKGKKLILMTLVGDPETASFAQRLFTILKSAGLDVASSSGMMTITPSGLSFTSGANRTSDLEVIGNALIKAGIATKPIQAQIEGQSPDNLTLVVGPKH